MELAKIYCPDKRCGDYRKKGINNISVIGRYGKGRYRLLRCRTCGFRFSERRWNIFFGLHTDEGTIRETLIYLFEGKSIRKTAKEVGLDKDTVQRIWNRVVESWGIVFEEFLKDLNLQGVDFKNLVAFPPESLWNTSLNKKIRKSDIPWLYAKMKI